MLFARKTARCYRVSRDVAEGWPELLKANGFEIDQNPGWARKCTEFGGGLPAGTARDPKGRKVDVYASDNTDGSYPPLETGHYVDCAYTKRNEEAGARVMALLEDAGGVLVERFPGRK